MHGKPSHLEQILTKVDGQHPADQLIVENIPIIYQGQRIPTGVGFCSSRVYFDITQWWYFLTNNSNKQEINRLYSVIRSCHELLDGFICFNNAYMQWKMSNEQLFFSYHQTGLLFPCKISPHSIQKIRITSTHARSYEWDNTARLVTMHSERQWQPISYN